MTAATGVMGYAPGVAVSNNRPSEKEIYEKMWADVPEYRMVSPGEHIALEFLKQAKPKPGSSVLDIGTGTGRGAFNLAVFGGLKVKMLDFAANCLDADIRPMLETQKDMLSFEQADITDGIPFSAQYGFCTDVLEHIPPTEVDKVLDNCLKACQHMFFQISTIDDVCGAAIGHPLHLTVKPYEWWLKKFADRDCAVHWSRKDSISCCFYVSAWTDAKEFSETGLINVPDGTFLANVKENIKNGWKQVSPHEANDFELMILGGGPSLNEFEDEIREKQKAGIKIVTLNGAYNWCSERGIGPVTQIMVDAREFNKRFVQPIDPKNLYLISSQCHPAVFEGLPKERTYLWHTSCEDFRETLEAQYPEGWWSIPGGSTVLLRALPLLRMLGYKKFHLYGCDSCMMEKAHHAFPQKENDDAHVVRVKASGSDKVYLCHPWMASQAQEFINTIKHFGNEFELIVYGAGLLAHLLECGATLEEVDTERELAALPGIQATPA